MIGILLTMRDVPEPQREPMSREATEIFVCGTLSQQRGKDKVMDAAALLQEVGGESGPAAAVILISHLRAGDGTLRFSLMTTVFLAFISRNPARAVMWAHYLVRRSYETGAVVDNDVLAQDFPSGFPTDEGASRIWDAQKSGDGNRLDRDASVWRRPAAGGGTA